MKFYDIVLPAPKRGEYAHFFPICCLHIGHKNHIRDLAMRYRKFILNTPDVYAMSLGDDIENALPGDEKHNSMMWDSNMTPMEQYRVACEFWEPVVKKGKLIITHDSNHWWRMEAKTGISMAAQMNVFLRDTLDPRERAQKAPRFGRWQCLSRIHLGRQSYTVHSQHGSGGGTTVAAVINKLQRTAMTFHADVYLRGHHHVKAVHQDHYYAWKEGQNRPVKMTRTYGATAAFLDWDDAYPERMELPIPVCGAVKLSLSSRRHDVKIAS